MSETPMIEPNWKWWASSNEERYQGPYDTREEAIQTATADEIGYSDGDDGPVHIFYITEAHQAPIQLADYIDVVEMVERWEDSEFYELGDDESEKRLTDHITSEQWSDLQARLRDTARQWQAGHNIVLKSYNFTASRNSERIEVPATPTPRPGGE